MPTTDGRNKEQRVSFPHLYHHMEDKEGVACYPTLAFSGPVHPCFSQKSQMYFDAQVRSRALIPELSVAIGNQEGHFFCLSQTMMD